MGGSRSCATARPERRPPSPVDARPTRSGYFARRPFHVVPLLFMPYTEFPRHCSEAKSHNHPPMYSLLRFLCVINFMHKANDIINRNHHNSTKDKLIYSAMEDTETSFAGHGGDWERCRSGSSPMNPLRFGETVAQERDPPNGLPCTARGVQQRLHRPGARSTRAALGAWRPTAAPLRSIRQREGRAPARPFPRTIPPPLRPTVARPRP